MKKNEGSIDRIIRAIIGIAALAAAFTMLDVMTGAIVGIIVAAVGAIALVTAIVGFCPAYKLLGMQTCPKTDCDCAGDCNAPQ